MPKRTVWMVWGVLAAAGCMPAGIKIMAVPADRTLREFEVLRDSGWVFDKIALVDVDGVLLNQPSGGLLSRGEHPVSFVVEKLQAARRDASVKAVLLRINSPGGSVTASDMLYEEIRRFRATGKPVVAMLMDLGTSGGYYVACACDEILAQRSTVTGSIGVIMQSVDVSGTLGKLGMVTEAIKSGPRKDAGSPFRPLEPEDRAMFQAVIDDLYARFVDVVAAGRPGLDRAAVLAVADGRIYTARQALEAGLIDGVTTLPGAVEHLKQKAGIRRCRVVTYQRPMSWNPNIYARSAESHPPAVRLIDVDIPSWLQPGRARFMYLWVP